MSVEAQVIENAKKGKLLTHKCTKCGYLHLSTAYYCLKCGSKGFEDVLLDGTGTIATYTIITVAPAGFEKYTPYAFVVLQLDNAQLRISGFMAGIATPADLPVGTRAKITGFDERGIIIEKQ
ncbi:Zn-ribbon domain-containing OB-fold protein [Lishizhenia sp.]|uniref:Zn-ribbon domain-containing OB-fold protein n=1 Tax=Lishizhenia sp. TaxID=2497594 RepID=UPI00299ED418|nr:OB-fold domain-containing protein [Lishizhenia sp.]MDX1447368.1 OB-fold domain-containing protein [Lishizhenia sp.]